MSHYTADQMRAWISQSIPKPDLSELVDIITQAANTEEALVELCASLRRRLVDDSDVLLHQAAVAAVDLVRNEMVLLGLWRDPMLVVSQRDEAKTE